MENLSFSHKKSDEKEKAEIALDLIKQTLLLNPENQKLSKEDLEKMAIRELFDSHD